MGDNDYKINLENINPPIDLKSVRKINEPKEKDKEEIPPIYTTMGNIYQVLLSIIELLIVGFILATAFIWLLKIVLWNDGDILKRVTNLADLISKDWIGFLFFAGLLFFRVVIYKITTLSKYKDMEFNAKINSIYSSGKDK